MPEFIKELVDGFQNYVIKEGGEDGLIKVLYDKGQHPKYLVFACADSRSAPEIICGLNAGDDFDMRWGGPFIPPYDPDDTFSGMINDHLGLFIGKGIKEIAIIGHEDCAAAGIVASTGDTPENTVQRVGQPFLTAAKSVCHSDNHDILHRMVERQVVIQGLKNLETYPPVKDALEKGQIHIHGLMYAMSDARLEKYYPEKGTFEVIAQRPEAPDVINDPHDSWDHKAFS